MKLVKDLETGLQNKDRFESQFQQYSDVNILWIAPQLSGRQLYRSILPYMFLDDEDVCTAINGLQKHAPEAQLIDIDVALDSKQLLWANVIVFPFTTQPLWELYEQIRTIHPQIKIIYSVDFNFYQLPNTHPYSKLFSYPTIRSIVEDNMFYADTVLVSNRMLDAFLTKKLVEMGQGKYFTEPKVKVGCIPFLMDEETVKGNIYYQPIHEGTKHFIPVDKMDKRGKFRLGIVATNVYADDINSYEQVFKDINKSLKDKVQLVFFGFDGNYNNKSLLKGVDFEFHKPQSIIHYFKKLEELNLDLLLIPLKDSLYNKTSENYNKWMEAGILNVPVLVQQNIYPYSTIISNGHNGFTFHQKKEIIPLLEDFIKNPKKIEQAGRVAHEQITADFSFSDRNRKTLLKIYS